MERIITETPSMSNKSNNSSLWSSFTNTKSSDDYDYANGTTNNFNETSNSNGSESGTKTNIVRYLLIIVVLGFLGINLFSYLGNVVEYLKSIFGPGFNTVLSFFGFAAGETAKTAIDVASKGTKLGLDVASKGTKLGVDVAAGTLTTGINVLQGTLDGNAVRNNIDSGKQTLDKALQNAERNINREIVPDGPVDRKPSSKIEGNLGFCYIGEYKGFRSCASITESDKCLSGDIFPTREICINPNLRQ